VNTPSLLWTHLPYREHSFLTVNTPSLLWTHFPYSEHTFLSVNKPSLLWTHLPYREHIFLTVNTPSLLLTHLPYCEHTFLTVNTPSLPWTHLPYCEHTFLTVNTHLPYAHNLVTCDFFFWSRVNSQMRGLRFQEVPKFRNNGRTCKHYLISTKTTTNHTVIYGAVNRYTRGHSVVMWYWYIYQYHIK